MSQFILYGGKGGVGKTTCSSATALAIAKQGQRTLVVSTDPAHSISDVFDQEIGSEPTSVSDEYPLSAMEVDPEHRFNENYEDTLDAITNEAESLGLDLGGELDIQTEGLVGSDEMAVVDLFSEFIDNNEWDYVVFDTAPTGHTLRMLQLPEVLDKGIGRLLEIKSQFGGLANKVTGFIGGNDSDDETGIEDVDIDKTKNQMRQVSNVLQDTEQTQFRVVMEPERLSMLETERLLAQLREYEIGVGGIVANKVLQDIDESCSLCSGRRETQQEVLAESGDRFTDIPIVEIPLLEDPNEDGSLEIVAENIMGEPRTS